MEIYYILFDQSVFIFIRESISSKIKIYHLSIYVVLDLTIFQDWIQDTIICIDFIQIGTECIEGLNT